MSAKAMKVLIRISMKNVLIRISKVGKGIAGIVLDMRKHR